MQIKSQLLSEGPMAYKEESDQQFMETIINQARGPSRRPMGMGGQQFGGDPGYGPNDDSFRNERSPMKLRTGGFQNLDGANQAGAGIDQDASTDQDTDVWIRSKMDEIKQTIKDKERELHELQQQKVELMRQLTGRL